MFLCHFASLGSGGHHEIERNQNKSQTQGAGGHGISVLLTVCLQPLRREPSIETLLRLSKLFKVSVDELLGNEEVVDTSITEDEAMMVQAMRQADERACQDALVLLRCHKTK